VLFRSMLAPQLVGGNVTGLMHHTDWLPTLLEAADIQYQPAQGFELHGVSQWKMLTAGAPSTRNETICNIDPMQPAIGDNTMAPGAGNAAIVTADGWKLVLGYTGPPWLWSPEYGPAGIDPRDATDVSPFVDVVVEAVDPGSSSCSVSEGVCYPGGDMTKYPKGTPTANAEACCALCDSLVSDGCLSWTYRTSTGMCWLKSSSTLTPTPNSDCTSSASAPQYPVWPLKNMTAALFNLTNDPWERQDLSADFPDLVSSLTARLAVWGKSAMVPYWATSPVDPLSNPSLRNGTWTPWLA